MGSIIGYGLHQYRTSADNKAVILNDEEVSDQPEGGNGKTLLVNAMGKLRKLVIKDGKNFDSKSSFLWSDVDETTGIVLIDDVNNKFNIENLFSTISNGFNIQIKFKNQYHLRLEKSPVVFITTNNIIRGASSSFMRRQYNVDIYQYFSNKHTPKKEFGHIFLTIGITKNGPNSTFLCFTVFAFIWVMEFKLFQKIIL